MNDGPMLKDLVGQTFDLYGADAGFFCIANAAMGKVVLEAVEDKSDGYHSSLDNLRLVTDPAELAKLVFFERPVAQAVVGWISMGGDAEPMGDLIGFRDADQHLWLAVGTDCTDGYYPSYEFTWTPKPCQGCVARGLQSMPPDAPAELHAEGCLVPLSIAAKAAVDA